MNIKDIEIRLRAKAGPARERWQSHFKSDYFKDVVTQFLIIPSVAILLTSWVLGFYYYRVSPYQVPLKYNSFLGIFSLGAWYNSYFVLLIMLFCFFVNIYLAKIIYDKDKFLSYTITASNIFLVMILLTVVVNFGRTIQV